MRCYIIDSWSVYHTSAATSVYINEILALLSENNIEHLTSQKNT